MEDEPKECSRRKRSELCRPEELILQPKGCKSSASLEPIHLNHFTCFQHTRQCSVVLSMQKVSFWALPNHEASQVSPVNKRCFREHKGMIFLFTNSIKNVFANMTCEKFRKVCNAALCLFL